MEEENSGFAKRLVALIIFSFLNLAIIYLAIDGIPNQDDSIIYGTGMLQNIDINS